MSTWETGKPAASEELRRARAEAAFCLRASGVPGAGTAPFKPALSIANARGRT